MVKKTKVVCKFVSFSEITKMYEVKFYDESIVQFNQNEVTKIQPHEFLQSWGKQS